MLTYQGLIMIASIKISTHAIVLLGLLFVSSHQLICTHTPESSRLETNKPPALASSQLSSQLGSLVPEIIMAEITRASQILTCWAAVVSWCWHLSEYLALAALSNVTCETVLAINNGQLPGALRRALLSASTVIIFLKLVNLMTTNNKTHEAIKEVEKKADGIDEKIDIFKTETSANFLTSKANQEKLLAKHESLLVTQKKLLTKQSDYHAQTEAALETITQTQNDICNKISALEQGLLEKIKNSIQETLKEIFPDFTQLSQKLTAISTDLKKAEEDRNTIRDGINQLLKKTGCATESEVPSKNYSSQQQVVTQNISNALLFNSVKK